MSKILKNIIILFIFIILLNNKSISFYYNTEYQEYKTIINNELNINLSNGVNNCLNKYGIKFFNNHRNIRQYCYYQLLYFIDQKQYTISKHFPYDEFAEMNFFWNNTPDKRINNFYLEKISKNNIINNDINPNLLFKYNDNIFIHTIIKNDLELLNKEYQKTFGKKIYINSGYRSIKQQEHIYNNYIELYGKEQLLAAKPGLSEHHLGTAIDIKKEYNSNGLLNYEWLKSNAWKYGFIQTYNNNCIKDYGIINEDWHYRWVGIFLSTKWKTWELDNKDKCNIDFLNY